MKFSYKVSPNYAAKQSTTGIMLELSLALVVVTVASAIWYGVTGGASLGIRVILLSIASVVTALCTETLYLLARKKKDIAKELLHSYGWVTGLIIPLITRINVSFYAIIIATAIAILFGKMLFGGFGQNIFNPAAFAEAIIMNSFSASVAADIQTGATPLAAMKSYGWVVDGSALQNVLGQFGNLSGMFLGNYQSVIGGSCALLLILVAVYLIARRIIDYRLTVTYIVTVFVVSLIVGLMHGAGIEYAIVNVLAGGVLFAGVFMLTDPVTSPVSIPGRYVFAVGAAALTLIIRWKSNLPDGALYSILIMNMLTPAIDQLFDGSQIKDATKIARKAVIAMCAFLVAVLLVGSSLVAKTPTVAEEPKKDDKPAEAVALSAEDFSENNAECTETSNDGTTAVYACKAKGFEGVNEATVTIDVAKKTVVSIVVTKFSDTEEVGDQATTEEQLKKYVGATADSKIDATTGATFTSKSLRAMIATALKSASAVALGKEDFKDNKAECSETSNDGTTAIYACKAHGFEGVNEATVTVDVASKSVKSIEVTKFGDTESVGDQATKAAELDKYKGVTLESKVDSTTGATFTSTSLRAMITTALQAATK